MDMVAPVRAYNQPNTSLPPTKTFTQSKPRDLPPTKMFNQSKPRDVTSTYNPNPAMGKFGASLSAPPPPPPPRRLEDLPVNVFLSFIVMLFYKESWDNSLFA